MGVPLIVTVRIAGGLQIWREGRRMQELRVTTHRPQPLPTGGTR